MSGGRLQDHLRRQWFLFGMAAVAVAAWLAPTAGAPHAALNPDGCDGVLVALIFLGNGLTLATGMIDQATRRWRLHVYVQLLSLGAIPLLALAADPLLGGLGVPDGLRTGVLVLACLPTTVTSAVVFTRAAGGNTAAALCNTILGNGLGVVVTPLLILALTGRQGGIAIAPTMLHLAVVVVAPFILGQLLRLPWSAALDRMRPTLSIAGQACLLVIVWHVFCTSIASASAPGPATVIGTGLAMLVLHLLLVAVAWIGSAWPALALTVPDRIAATICASQKTVALGIPVILCVYANDPAMGLITLPLVLYHPIQIAVSALLTGHWSRLAARS